MIDIIPDKSKCPEHYKEWAEKRWLILWNGKEYGKIREFKESHGTYLFCLFFSKNMINEYMFEDVSIESIKQKMNEYYNF